MNTAFTSPLNTKNYVSRKKINITKNINNEYLYNLILDYDNKIDFLSLFQIENITVPLDHYYAQDKESIFKQKYLCDELNHKIKNGFANNNVFESLLSFILPNKYVYREDISLNEIKNYIKLFYVKVLEIRINYLNNSKNLGYGIPSSKYDCLNIFKNTLLSFKIKSPFANKNKIDNNINKTKDMIAKVNNMDF